MTTASTKIHPVIQDLARQFGTALQQGNAADIANFYSNDGMLLPTGFDIIKGRQEIKSFWLDAINIGIRNIRLDLVELEQHGDTAIEISKYTLTNEKEDVMEQGKGMVIWKYHDHRWMMHRDIRNSDV